MKRTLLLTCLICYCCLSFGQDEGANPSNAAPLSPSASQASRMNANPVNLFTGQPSITVPIYSFKGHGLSMNISLDYVSGAGIKVAESPSVAGLGWCLNTGGSIVRTVRGMPDDRYPNGFIYAPPIPDDIRAAANSYYYDSLDAEQDVFQFNLPGYSGKFYIGKNKQIVVVPASKVKIIPHFSEDPDSLLNSFRIVTEDGTKYDFATRETTSNSIFYPPGFIGRSANAGVGYTSAWYLTRIISAFYTDTIRLNYTPKLVRYNYSLPQLIYVDAFGNKKKPTVLTGQGQSSYTQLESIVFPNKTQVSFIYGFNDKYDEENYALSKIKISDTTFRYGYFLEYQDTFKITYPGGSTYEYPSRLLLKTITPYTAKQKQESYRFDYFEPYFQPVGGVLDTVQNRKDHWGYYNGKNNGDSIIPKTDIFPSGADRRPTLSALRNALIRCILPTGGIIQYSYELNTLTGINKQPQQVAINAQTNASHTVSLAQFYNDQHLLTFQVDKSLSRSGAVPVSGAGNLVISIKSTDGSILYKSVTVSLFRLFYLGLKTWKFNLPNGTYRIESALTGGTTVSSSFPINISWENTSLNASKPIDTTGGLRVSSVQEFEKYGALPVSSRLYKYVLENGQTSGFLGGIPRYDYPYRETIQNGSTTTTDYTAIGSEPIGNMDYTQINPFGYSRVEVMNISLLGASMGKEVHEFTTLKDVNVNLFTAAFPYAPQDLRAWGIGLPKRISVYDSLGNIVKRTTNTYGLDTVTYENANFRSVKLGHNQTTFYGDPNSSSTPRTRQYTGEEYFVSSGRAYLASMTDSMYYAGGSTTVTYQQFEYDTNYNVKKVISNYDRSRGLQKETRMYYPYNYTVGGAIGKLRDSAILTVPVANEVWITGDGNPRLVKGMATAYKEIVSGQVRPDTIYAFESNKPIPQSTLGTFNPGKINQSATYFKSQQKIDYDAKGNIRETTDFNTGITNAIIRDYDNEYEIAAISNGKYSEVAYTSFEADGSGNWVIAGSARNTAESITGYRSYNLSEGTISKSGLNSAKTYLITFWAKTGATVSINGSIATNLISTQGTWNLYSTTKTGVTTITMSGSGLVDELRLHPKETNMVTSTYEPMIGVTSTVDGANTLTYNEYDGLHRLLLARDRNKNIRKRYQYEDSAMLINIQPIWYGIEQTCAPSLTGEVDSLYRDINPFSDSSGYVKTVRVDTNYCTCSVYPHPDYKIVNGSCEQGARVVTSSVRKRIWNPAINNYEWKWECTYHYHWSDNTDSPNYIEYYDTSDGCYLIGPIEDL